MHPLRCRLRHGSETHDYSPLARYVHYLVDHYYSRTGPTLQLAAETVDSRLRRPTTCSRIASFFEVAVSCAVTSTRPLSWRHWRSNPMHAPMRVAMPRLMAAWSIDAVTLKILFD